MTTAPVRWLLAILGLALFLCFFVPWLLHRDDPPVDPASQTLRDLSAGVQADANR